MKGTRLLAPAALALLAGACTKSTAPGVTIALRQPAALAIFRGYTLKDATKVRPYLVVANASRDDLTVIDATDDTAVQSPIQLRSLVIPVAGRPTLLAAASFGDGEADLLVAVSGGDSVLQVVETWTPSNVVYSNPAPAAPEPARAADLGSDVLALAPLPSPPGTARIAAALAGRRIAVAEWARQADGSIQLAASTLSPPLAFQPLSLAALPDDPAVAGVQTEIYAATLDEIVAGTGVHGVAALTPDLGAVRVLDARGPTRLVAAARLRERKADSTATGVDAFDVTQPLVPRVYAVLDESGCGLERPIECGVVTLDPAKVPGPGDDSIPEDWSGRMPYRAPVRVPGRPLALAVAPPPAVAPSTDASASFYSGDFMRLYAGASEQATTGVAAVASDDGRVYILDLGRFKLATPLSTLATLAATVPEPAKVDDERLWLQDGAGTFAVTAADAAKLVSVTPGYTRDAVWTITWEGVLSSDVVGRPAEAGLDASGKPWLALQAGDGPAAPGRIVNEVVKLFHPALGVHVGDIVVLKAAGVPGCTGTKPPGTAATVPEAEIQREFEGRIKALLAPTGAYPGGAVLLTRPDPIAQPEWDACFTALDALVASSGGIATRLLATLRAPGLVLGASGIGYAGRPALGQTHALEYPAGGEDALAASCPLADWDGTYPVPAAALTCAGTGACNDRDTCEALVLARKARRVHHNFEDCSYLPAVTDCADRWAGVTFPAAFGPTVAFRVGVEGGDGVPSRGLAVAVSTVSGAAALSTRATGSPFQASGAIAFDRSTENAAAGYRFLVSYPADMVYDVSPSVNPLNAVVIR